LASIAQEAGAPDETKPAAPTRVRRVTRAAPASSPDLLELASQQEQSGQWEEALATYQKATGQEATRYDALLAMGRIYETMGFPIAAIEAFDEALTTQAEIAPVNRRNEG
jgi:tetratricopeptide (TPR) repeat protein